MIWKELIELVHVGDRVIELIEGLDHIRGRKAFEIEGHTTALQLDFTCR